MNKKIGTILGVILGIVTFVGVVALLCYIFRDKLRMLCNCGCDCDCCCDDDECDCDCCCGDDDHGYFEVVESCGCCDDGADEEPVADGE